MKQILISLLSVLVLGCSAVYSQAQKHWTQTNSYTITSYKQDFLLPVSIQSSKSWQRATVAPLLFISAGLSSLRNDDLLSNYEIREERNEYLPKFHSHADDFLQYLPIAAVYGLNLGGIKGKNDFVNRTAILAKAELIVGVLTFSLKKLTVEPRPDTGRSNSFPSGHTAQAFAAATFMAKEYGDQSLWYSVGAYTVATGVGTMRVLNNRHWISDVLVGAGIGILSTNLAYLTHQYKWGRKHSTTTTIVVPSYDGQTGMINFFHRIG
jgi:membrane-associated phospholipid phosphatase